MPKFTTAYAGSGKIDDGLVAQYLDQLLPQELGMVYIPEKEIPKRKLPGLFAVNAWLERELPEGATIPVADLVKALTVRAEEGDDVALVMVYDPENGDDVALARDAHANGIRVIDLCNAADDLLFNDETEAETEEPDSEPETPPFETDETPAREPATASSALSPAEQIQQAADAGIAAAEAARASRSPVVPVAAQERDMDLTIHVVIPAASIGTLAQAIVAAMGMQAMKVLEVSEMTTEPSEPSEIVKEPTRTATDPAGQPEGTIVHYYNKADDKYRPARGRKRAEEERVFLTPEEVAKVKAEGLML